MAELLDTGAQALRRADLRIVLPFVFEVAHPIAQVGHGRRLLGPGPGQGGAELMAAPVFAVADVPPVLELRPCGLVSHQRLVRAFGGFSGQSASAHHEAPVSRFVPVGQAEPFGLVLVMTFQQPVHVPPVVRHVPFEPCGRGVKRRAAFIG